MSAPPFHRTRMGQRFFERQLLQLISHLGRIADNLQSLVTEVTPLPVTVATQPSEDKTP